MLAEGNVRQQVRNVSTWCGLEEVAIGDRIADDQDILPPFRS